MANKRLNALIKRKDDILKEKEQLKGKDKYNDLTFINRVNRNIERLIKVKEIVYEIRSYTLKKVDHLSELYNQLFEEESKLSQKCESRKNKFIKENLTFEKRFNELRKKYPKTSDNSIIHYITS